MNGLHQAIIYLLATVIAVPLFTRLGLGAVLGSLCAGMVIGPHGLNLVGDVHAVLELGELGVVFLLFILGLELQPKRLWDMRRQVFGLGGAQLTLTGTALAGAAAYFGLGTTEAILVGLALSLSSTAFALQLLGERNQLTAPHGRAAFGILLFQDLAVIVLLAILPMLAGDQPAQGGCSLALAGLRAVAVLGGVVSSKWLLRPFLRVVAAQRSHTLFTAASLLVVVGIAEAVAAVGLSAALGAFLAGMLFADSEYRHALEADIDPFKGLLLGLFFMAVGMSVNLSRVWAEPTLVAGLVVGLIGVKASILFVLGRRTLGRTDDAAHLALSISQGGEFAFVIFGQATRAGAMGGPLSELLIAAVTLSMAATPILYALYERLIMPRLRAEGPNAGPYHVAPEAQTAVIVAGFGRMGQIVGRVLRGLQIPFVALDADAQRIEILRRFGAKVFYGDAARVDLLRAAGAEQARVLVLTLSNVELSLRCVETVRQHFPHLKIIARARDRAHAHALLEAGVERVIRETLHSSLKITAEALAEVGLTFSDGHAAIDRFFEHDEALLRASVKVRHDQAQLARMSRAASAELEALFEQDAPGSKPLALEALEALPDPALDAALAPLMAPGVDGGPGEDATKKKDS